MRRGAAGRVALALALVAIEATAQAQQDQVPPAEPPAAPESPAAPSAAAPSADALPAGVTPLAGERPLRFFLTGGNSFVATRIGEDAEFFWVRAPDGRLARVRKDEIARMSYELDAAPPPRAPARPPSLLPLDEDDELGARPSPPGRGLVVGGAVLFGIFYGGTLLFAPGAEGPGELLLIPFFGPVVYGLARESPGEDVGGLAVVSVLQGAGALMIYLGLRQAAAARDNRRHWTRASSPALLALLPEVGPGGVALEATGQF